MPAAPFSPPAAASSAGSCPPEPVLPATARVRRRADFATALRGARVRSGVLVLHYGLVPDEITAPARAGVIVSRAVGGAVVRNRVRRRLRHLVRPLLAELPGGSILLVRALPAAAGMPSADLADSLRNGWARVPRPGPGS